MTDKQRPDDFVILQNSIPTLIVDLKYAYDDNIVGRPINGYAPDAVALLTEPATRSLQQLVQALQSTAMRKDLNLKDPTLLIWDAYRPQMAVDDFWQWSQSECEKTKADFYPNTAKNELFAKGYFAKQSSHSRGSTIDLTILDLHNGRSVALDMGTTFDFMDELSHTENNAISAEVYRNRQILKKLMNDFGWQGIDQEWWHFTFEEEPYKDTYFNFPVLNYQR